MATKFGNSEKRRVTWTGRKYHPHSRIIFRGRFYKFHDWESTLGAAKKEARKLIKQGFKVRIVPDGLFYYGIFKR